MEDQSFLPNFARPMPGPDPPLKETCDPPHWEDNTDRPLWEDIIDNIDPPYSQDQVYFDPPHCED